MRYKHLGLWILIVAGQFLISSEPAQALSIFVPQDYPTIQTGINASEDGDTVLISPGIYKEWLVCSKGITLMPEATTQWSVLIAPEPNQFQTGPGLAIQSAQGVTIRGLVFHVVCDRTAFVSITDSRVTIEACFFTQTEEWTWIPNFTIFSNGASDVTITRCIFSEIDRALGPVLGMQAGSLRIVNNTIYKCWAGIVLYNGTGFVQNNIVSECTRGGIGSAVPVPNADYNCVYVNGPDYEWNAVPGLSDFSADPMLLGFDLSPSSPCVDAGNPDSDFDDPDGTRNDVGARNLGCHCPCTADPECDSTQSVLDVIRTIDIAFRSDTEVRDTHCPVSDADSDCSGAIDVLDVVRMIDVAFRGASPTERFCSPCQ